MSPHPTPDHVLGSTPETVVWGRLTPHLPPVLRVRSGQSVAIDTLNPVGIQPQAPHEFLIQHGIATHGPVAETAEHYIPLGLHTSLDVAATQAVARTVDILAAQLGISPAEAYALASLLADYEVTQIVDGIKGIHGCIPKRLVQPQGPAWWGPGPAAQMGTAMRSHFSQGDLA